MLTKFETDGHGIIILIIFVAGSYEKSVIYWK